MFFELISSTFPNLLYFILHLSNSSSFPKPLNAKMERQYLEEYHDGSSEARTALIEHNLRLVAHIIKKYYAKTNDQEDLISIGTIGLIKGIDTFNMEKGTRLATYAARCIENEILMHFRNQKKMSQDVFMSDPIDMDSEGNPLTLMDIISVNDSIADNLELKIKSEKLHQFVSELMDEREKEIIFMRYGILGTKPLTQREVAEKLKISRSYVSRIEKKALERLKSRFDEGEARKKRTSLR